MNASADPVGRVETDSPLADTGDRLVGDHPVPFCARFDGETKAMVTMAFLESSSDLLIVQIEGPLLAPVKAELCLRVERLLEGGNRRILVDLAPVSDIDAAGIGELVRVFNLTDAAGGVLRIAEARGRVRQLLHVAGLLRVLDAGFEAARPSSSSLAC